MRTTSLMGCVLFVSAVVFGWRFPHMAEAQTASGSKTTEVEGPPRIAFTATIAESSVSYKGPGAPSVSKTLKEAIREDYSRAITSTDENAIRTVTLVPQMMRVDVCDRTKMKSTRYGQLPSGIAKLPAPKHGERCAASYAAGHESIYSGEEKVSNFVAYRYQLPVSTWSDTEILRTTVWMAPALGCYAIQQRTERVNKATQEITGVFERKPLDIVVGPPDPALFAVPVDYAEAPPSEFQRANIIAATGVLNSGKDTKALFGTTSQRWQRDDEDYKRNHQLHTANAASGDGNHR